MSVRYLFGTVVIEVLHPSKTDEEWWNGCRGSRK